MNILEALDDTHLFGPFFDHPSWDAWRAFLAALTGSPMSEAQLAIYRACTGRTEAPNVPFSEAALIVGRRGGKSRVLATIAVALATLRDYEPHLAPGEVATVAVLAANRSQARSIFRYAAGLLHAVDLLAATIQDETGETITLTNRVVIEIATASFRTARGYSFAAVLADEIAFWRSDESSANPDTEILRALRPGMASIPGSVLLLASSPYAKKGELYGAFRRHYGKDGARVLVWKADTATMNPRIDPAIIAEAYESDPEAARAEYGAEFRDDLADFVTREVVDAVTCWGRHELPPQPGVVYSAFCDPSGGVSDAMTLSVGHIQDGSLCVLDALLEIRPPFDPEAAVAECAALLRRFGISRVVGDRYAGQWPVARFKEHGIAFEQCARPKSDLYHDLLPLLNARRAELLENARMSAQLVGLERRTARSGKDSIDHSPGGHDDLANAVAGVLVGLDLDRRPGLVKAADLLVEGEPVPLPSICDAVFAVVAIGEDGTAAVVYAASSQHYGIPCLIVDFDVEPLSGTLFASIRDRMQGLAVACRARMGGLGTFADVAVHRQIEAAGMRAHELPPELQDVAMLGLPVAGQIAAGAVKICTTVAEKAQASPFGAALDFRAGDLTCPPLRTAALQAIGAALDCAPRKAA